MMKNIMELYSTYDLMVSGDINGKQAWNIIKEIEAKYPVDTIRLLDGTRIWNLIRIYIYTFYQEQTGRRHLDLLRFAVEMPFSTLIHQIVHTRVTITYKNILNSIADFVCTETGVDRLKFMSGLLDYIRVFSDMKTYYHKMLAWSGETEVRLPCGYGRLPMAKAQACRELGIKCIEEQHGLITRYHPGYCRASPTLNHDCIPEYLHTYNEQFAEIAKEGFLFDTEKVTAVGYPRVQPIILVTSQWILADKIHAFISESIGLFNDEYQILFKPHPFDERDYDDLHQKGVILKDNKTPIDELLRMADIHVTVYSASGIDASMYDVPTVFIDVCKLMKPSPYIVQTPEEFVERVKQIC